MFFRLHRKQVLNLEETKEQLRCVCFIMLSCKRLSNLACFTCLHARFHSFPSASLTHERADELAVLFESSERASKALEVRNACQRCQFGVSGAFCDQLLDVRVRVHVGMHV